MPRTTILGKEPLDTFRLRHLETTLPQSEAILEEELLDIQSFDPL